MPVRGDQAAGEKRAAAPAPARRLYPGAAEAPTRSREAKPRLYGCDAKELHLRLSTDGERQPIRLAHS